MELSGKKEHILNVALRLFAEHGYSGTSVRQIAKDADVNVSMISYYFGGKEGLLSAIISCKSDAMKIQMERILKDEWSDTEEKIKLLVEEMVARFLENRVMYRLMIQEQNFQEKEEMKRVLMKLRQSRFDQFKDVLLAGQKKGFFKKDINIPLLHAGMIGLLKQVYFTDDFYYDLLELPRSKKREEMMLKIVTDYLINAFKLLLNDSKK